MYLGTCFAAGQTSKVRQAEGQQPHLSIAPKQGYQACEVAEKSGQDVKPEVFLLLRLRTMLILNLSIS